ncbi:MarR family winged helix-turn-helix transcriptional regulator [Aquibacillus rhizosphaerae]|uniref:MarR family transcriptional regulator n=1 Tax=Aquibacillus rhizosphaerae TaxID=3051431 RepID=A0ABT7L8A3_9BACI|nr:MarR family transcriptional regulator [Aquibacillus sp. LR5S19]MDL4842086.1 MarR family transcriptional regulator [Aquibacillus sp. LR5S19]
MKNEFEHLKLENQICFLLYAASREMTKQYKPLLEDLGVTYPQYLVLLLLWENDLLTVKEIGQMLYLDSGTLTPMLKRMEEQSLLERERSSSDQRSVFVKLTPKGYDLKQKANCIPNHILSSTGNSDQENQYMKTALVQLLEKLKESK